MHEPPPPSYSFCTDLTHVLPPISPPPSPPPYPPPPYPHPPGTALCRISIPVVNSITNNNTTTTTTGSRITYPPIQIQSQHQRRCQSQPIRKLPSICCCQPKTWTRVTAVITLFVSVFTLVLVCTTVYAHWEDDKIRKEMDSDFERRVGRPFLGEPKKYPNLWLPSLLAPIGLVLGSFLFAGVHYGKLVLILIWIVPMGLGLTFVLFRVFIEVIDIYKGIHGVGLVIPFVFILAPTGLTVLAFIIVCIHARNLFYVYKQQKDQRSDPSQVYYHGQY